MKLEKGQISPGQIFLMVIAANFASPLLNPPGVRGGRDEWLVILGGLSFALILAFVFCSLCRKFPGKTLVEFNTIIYGPILGKLISLAYLFYFFILTTLSLRLFGVFLSAIIFPSTPTIVFIGSIILICASAVRNGIEVIARTAQVLVPLSLIFITITVLLSIPFMDFMNFLPIFDLPIKEYLKLSYVATGFPFGETLALFLMFVSFTGKQQQEKKITSKYLLLGIFISGVTLVIATVRNTAVLGNTKAFATYASYEAARLINLGGVFTRMEILVALNFLAMGFLTTTLLYYGLTLGLAQVLEIKTYLPLVLPLGTILACITITQFDNSFEYRRFSASFMPYLSFPFVIGIPLLSLLICKIRGIPKEKKQPVL